MSERHIVDYMIVDGSAAYLLAESVRNLMKQGWQPYMSAYVGSSTHYQPMVKYDTTLDKYRPIL